ncbi:hypothetical protein UPYG_G00242200 [Umbra pygmaea]|uniref:Transcriptional adapter n=1 Tax=Umbra pygmaea TaxID=75934 RepID=A0ABD0X627_UMBPY
MNINETHEFHRRQSSTHARPQWLGCCFQQQADASNMADLGKKYCVNCLADVTNLRLRCTDCPDIELCPECFSAGAEIGNHRRWHGYQQVDGGRFSLWGPEAEGRWTSREEQLLLDAIEQYGFGNWEDMATHVGASRTPQEVMDHYVSMYIHGNLGKACIPDSIPNRVTDHTCPSGGPLSPSLTTPLPPLDVTLSEQQQLGYMPLRDDYEIEYDQEAEKLISGLSVNYDDEDVEIEMKRAHVDMYVRKLRERQRRKNVARDYNLVPIFLGRDKKEKPGILSVVGGGGSGGTVGGGAVGNLPTPTAPAVMPGVPAVQTVPKRKITKEEKEQRVKLRGMCQFMAQREFEDFFDNMHKELGKAAKVMRAAAPPARTASRDWKSRPSTSTRRHDTNGRSAKRIRAWLRQKLGVAEDRAQGPSRYLTAKTIIIKDQLQKRQGIPSKSRLPSYLDKVLKKRILSFLTESGWISRDAS